MRRAGMPGGWRCWRGWVILWRGRGDKLHAQAWGLTAQGRRSDPPPRPAARRRRSGRALSRRRRPLAACLRAAQRRGRLVRPPRSWRVYRANGGGGRAARMLRLSWLDKLKPTQGRRRGWNPRRPLRPRPPRPLPRHRKQKPRPPMDRRGKKEPSRLCMNCSGKRGFPAMPGGGMDLKKDKNHE